jgi:hypothetical protein
VLLLAFTGIDVAAIALGLLARHGIGWLAGINVTLVMTFIYVTAFPNVILLFYGLIYGSVFVILMVHRPWFLAMGRWRAMVVRGR